MKLSAHYHVGVSADRVYAALTDPAILQRCIPGCEELSPDGVDRFRARIKVGVAGLKGVYTGTAELRDRNPPHSFTLVVDGKGAPGFVRASAKIVCAPADGGSRVDCDADVQVGGLIAADGSRLVEAAARQQMDAFFRQLALAVTAA
jgi:carbon monoxide dehydrogenase subunit G